MNQPPVYQPAPPPKKSNKTWIIVVIIVLGLCLCFFVAAAGVVGYFYLQPGTAANMLPPEILNAIPGGAGTTGETPNGEGSSALQAGADQLDMINKTGAASISLNLTVPDGMKVVEKVAIVAPLKDEPELCTLYIAMLLENPTAMTEINIAYQMWMYSTDVGYGEEIMGGSGSGDHRWLTIPVQQPGVLIWKSADCRVKNFPSRIDFTLEAVDPAKSQDKSAQPSLEKLNDTSLPNPYFKAVSSEIVAAQQPAGNLYDIEANGKYINNLPVDNFAHGFFLFYDGSGNIVGFSSDQWSDKQLDIIPPQGEGDINGPLPYRLAIKPVKVVFYPYMGYDNVINLQRIK